MPASFRKGALRGAFFFGFLAAGALTRDDGVTSVLRHLPRLL